jgi:polar amino acid transport system substrate-binding protein
MKTILAATPRRLAISALAWLLSGGAALAQAASPPGAGTQGARTASAELVAAFAPSGTLRASINLGNPILATFDPHTHQPVGVSVDLAGELAKRLGVPLQLLAVTSAGASVENVEQDKADVGFFAIDPKRGQIIEFTRPYVLIEGVYAVRNDSPITTNAQVDQAGTTVAVSKGSAYDLFLSRELHHASIVRLPTSPGIVQGFLDQHLSVAAGIRQQLAKDAAKAGGMRLLDEPFMVIRQAMGLPKAKGSAAAQYLADFVEEMKTSGFVAAALARHQIEGAGVAGKDD